MASGSKTCWNNKASKRNGRLEGGQCVCTRWLSGGQEGIPRHRQRPCGVRALLAAGTARRAQRVRQQPPQRARREVCHKAALAAAAAASAAMAATSAGGGANWRGIGERSYVLRQK